MPKKINYALVGPVWGPWVICESYINLGQVDTNISVEACSDADAAGPFQVEMRIPGIVDSVVGIDSVSYFVKKRNPPSCTNVEVRVKNTGIHFPPVYLLYG